MVNTHVRALEVVLLDGAVDGVDGGGGGVWDYGV